MALDSGTQFLTISKRLPPEIMSKIFILCTTVTTRNLDDIDFEQDRSIPSHFNPTSVCRLWRSIAHSTPALWTSLSIYIPYRNIPQRIQDIQQWISQLGRLPTLHSSASSYFSSTQIVRSPSRRLDQPCQKATRTVGRVWKLPSYRNCYLSSMTRAVDHRS